MSQFLQDLVRIVWQALLPVPMPWRAGLIIGIMAISGYQLIRHLLPMLLLPEFWLTNRLRTWGLRPLPGTYAFGDAIGWALRVSRWLAWAAVLVVSVGVLAWYARPTVTDRVIAQYIDQAVAWWYSLENGVLAAR